MAGRPMLGSVAAPLPPRRARLEAVTGDGVMSLRGDARRLEGPTAIKGGKSKLEAG